MARLVLVLTGGVALVVGGAQVADFELTGAMDTKGAERARLLFASADALGEPTLYSVRADGSGRQTLAKGHAGVWSPDRRLIAFVPRTGTPGVAVMRADGRQRRQLVLWAAPAGPLAWSPDGRRIAFTALDLPRENSGGYDIHVVPAAGGGRRQLLRTDRWDEHPTDWSRDGRRIAYTRYDSNDVAQRSPEVWVLSPRTRKTRRLLRDAMNADWSFNGRRIAFVRGSRIWVARGDGSHARAITPKDPRGVDSPAWSPDGQRIAYVQGRRFPVQPRRLITIPAAGGHPQYVTPARWWRVFTVDW